MLGRTSAAANGNLNAILFPSSVSSDPHPRFSQTQECGKGPARTLLMADVEASSFNILVQELHPLMVVQGRFV